LTRQGFLGYALTSQVRETRKRLSEEEVIKIAETLRLLDTNCTRIRRKVMMIGGYSLMVILPREIVEPLGLKRSDIIYLSCVASKDSAFIKITKGECESKRCET
jgi:hypothetical protein